MGDHCVLQRFWVPAAVDRVFLQEWRVLAEMLVAEGLMETVCLLADIDDPGVRWTLLRWPSTSARRAWRTDERHRLLEDGIATLSSRVRVHRMTSILEVGCR